MVTDCNFSLSFQLKRPHGPASNFAWTNVVRYFKVSFYLLLGTFRVCQRSESAVLQLRQ